MARHYRGSEYVCWQGDYVRAKLLEEQETITPEQEAEIAKIPENAWVSYGKDSSGCLYINCTFIKAKRDRHCRK